MENKKIQITIWVLILAMPILLGLPVKGYSARYESSQVYIPREREIVEQIQTMEKPVMRQVNLVSGLTVIARAKIRDLENTGYWSHTNSNGCNFHCRVSSYLVTHGGRYSWIGENLYKGICDIGNAYRLWRLSPTHNAVLRHGYDEQILLTGKYGESKCYYVLIKGVVK